MTGTDQRTVHVFTRDYGMVAVSGEVVAEHFAITPWIDTTGKPAPFELQLIHIPTGQQIPVLGEVERDELILLACKLQRLALDWAGTTRENLTGARLGLVQDAWSAWNDERHARQDWPDAQVVTGDE
ncbi:hypothetical protein [Nocardia acidivorans]|uniref:hypothetical protein n=1 Tax=Nocardia acidivorans TaxID=404580 RepID=UPI00082E113C|nr:hypothetical protein [Nocardia acidivorans]